MKNKGGYRPGSGRPYGSGTYGEATIQIRVPLTLEKKIKYILEKYAAGDKEIIKYLEKLGI